MMFATSMLHSFFFLIKPTLALVGQSLIELMCIFTHPLTHAHARTHTQVHAHTATYTRYMYIHIRLHVRVHVHPRTYTVSVACACRKPSEVPCPIAARQWYQPHTHMDLSNCVVMNDYARTYTQTQHIVNYGIIVK